MGNYSFLAISGKQGDFQYFIIQLPLRLVTRLLLFDEVEVPDTLRKIRSLDPALVETTTNYLMTQATDYVLAPLIATLHSHVVFTALTPEHCDIGWLSVPFTAPIIIQHGQYQRAALQQFLAQMPERGNDTLPVMLVPDPDFVRSTRLYADFQQMTTQGTLSQRVLYAHSDLAIFVRQLIANVPLFRDRIELEKTTISNRSTALFTLSAVYQATQALLHTRKDETITAEQALLGEQFWCQLGEIIPQWPQLIRNEVTPSYLRENYVHSHTVTLVAIALAGEALIQSHPDDWSKRLKMLGSIDWSRKNTRLWEGRVMMRGRMSKTRDSIKLTTIALKRVMGLTIAEQEHALEQDLLRLHDTP
ncbi:MAG: DGQHR domain-containing protein [Candidatus Viridilinea halotolerans]|uniref:DGQHR domain-containing protein n=1 Tax=Candidatus Viridilinea halotolerans TaxID=2491704 RepID=A0A426U0I9_9CHLR|nr:MAG: DGQHR domain-containing protein [Candidatus Viridilinea halotolerans]